MNLNRCEGALEEGIVDDVTFTVFPADDPVSALDVAKAEIGADGLVLVALRGIDEQGTAGAKCTHDSSAGFGPGITFFMASSVKRDKADRKGFVKRLRTELGEEETKAALE
jgi:hypothetical protein